MVMCGKCGGRGRVYASWLPFHGAPCDVCTPAPSQSECEFDHPHPEQPCGHRIVSDEHIVRRRAGTLDATRLLMRTARDDGAQIDGCASHYDHERDGRVIVLTVFYPEDTGYPFSETPRRDAVPGSPATFSRGPEERVSE